MGFYDWLNKKNEPEEKERITQKVADFSSFKIVTDYIYEKSGIIDLDKRALAASRVQQFAQTQDIYNTNELLSKMKSDSSFYQEIINIVTVNETYFMRELKELEWLVSYIKKSDRKLKILSMPSSSGEEVYSILLLLLKNSIDINKVEIRGYDINSQAVEHATKGEYEEHSLHKIDKSTRDLYFTQTENNSYIISSMLKNSVSFYQKNIFDIENEDGKYDVVLSRNMFIYFDDEKREKALNKIVNILKPEGIYIKGHADYIKNHPNLENIEYGIYKKIIV